MLPDDRAGPSPPRRPRCNPPAQCDAPLARTSVRPASVDGSVSRPAGCSDGRGAARIRSIDGPDAGRAPPPDAHAGDRGQPHGPDLEPRPGSVLIRSPGLRGISEGATTTHP